MRNWGRSLLGYGLGVSLAAGLSACAAKAPVKPQATVEALEETPVPTVPPSAAATPLPESTPLPTRPIGKSVKPRKGQAIGPVITFFGLARADGYLVEPASVDKKGIPTYRTVVGSGFTLVVETKPGESGFEPGLQVFAHVPDDPKVRPDLEIEANRDLGDGSADVCDRRRPKIGGIPGINPVNFAETRRVSDAINDFSCRFETFLETDSACTMTPGGDFAFARKESTLQFCTLVARAYAFPVGTTLLNVRVRDTEGNPGPIKQMRIVRPPEPKKPGPKRPEPKKNKG